MKLFIPAAGLGTRMSCICNWTHKALIPINNKPIISHIIDSFPESIEIVIALGYMGNHVKEFLEISYPLRNINYVQISKFEGKGSGLTRTLLECKNYLQDEFFFISCDTLIDSKEFITEREFSTSWIGLSNLETDHLDVNKYRTSIINKNGDLQKLLNKNELPEDINSRFPYIGFSFIKEFKEFWKAYKNIPDKEIESGEFIGLSHLFRLGLLTSRKFNWLDTGSPNGYKNALEKLENSNNVDAIVLPKNNETIYFHNNKVIKYSVNIQFIKDRIDRVENIRDFCPELIDKKTFFYSYQFIEGETFSKLINVKNFDRLMIFLEDFWNSNINQNKNQISRKNYIIEKFYLEKTILRIEQYLEKKYKNDKYKINGHACENIFDLIKNLSIDDFSGIDLRASFHGDCHFENIILTPNGNFKLLDWRQDFANEKDNGDICYDYGKLLHGILVPHPIVHANKYSLRRNNNNVLISLELPEVYREIQKEFQRWHYNKGLNFKKTFLITSLIYLNIAALHHEGYDDFLFYYGKYLLSNYINIRDNKDFFVNEKFILI